MQIWEYVARENIRAADKVLDRLEAVSEFLETFPQVGRRRDDIGPEVRSLLAAASYLVLYRIKESQVEIVRYVHGRQNLQDMI